MEERKAGFGERIRALLSLGVDVSGPLEGEDIVGLLLVGLRLIRLDVVGNQVLSLARFVVVGVSATYFVITRMLLCGKWCDG